jgi:putative hydrolase of the HAD superfamily
MKDKYKHIILDFGGVIFNIDYHLTVAEFEKIGFTQFYTWYSQAKQHELFDKLETGMISPEKFFAEIRNISGLDLKDAQIENAWNALLIGLPQNRIELLKDLSSQYNLYLVSNTNIIHASSFQHDIDKNFGWENFKNLFNKVCLSHEIQKRKPNADVFEYVIESNGLNKDETLFVDDSIQHIDGASKIGIDSYFLDLKSGDSFENLFSKLMQP